MACAAGVPFDEEAIWRHFATIEGDELAAAFVRLLLLTDPQPLPAAAPASEQAAFEYYLRNWRPGSWFNSAPDSQKRTELRAKWGRNWTASISAVGELGDIASAHRPSATEVAPATVATLPDAVLVARVAALERRVAGPTRSPEATLRHA